MTGIHRNVLALWVGNCMSRAWLADERIHSWKDWAEAHKSMNPMKESRTTLRIKLTPREDISGLSTFRLVMLTSG